MDQNQIDQIKELIDYERNRTSPPEGFPKLPDLPGKRYTDPEFYELEKENLWKKSWLYAGHLDEIPNVGSYKLWERAGQPVILVRKNKEKVNAFYNMCRHRGAAIVREEYGEAEKLICGYHGFTYDYEGKLIGKRDPKDFVDFDDSCRNLHKVNVELFGNLIFVNFDLEAVSLKENLGVIYEELEEFQFGSLRLVDQYSYNLKCNWKIAMEANMEVYHVKSIHPETVHTGLDYTGNVNTFYPNGHGRMIAPNRSFPELPASALKANPDVLKNELNDSDKNSDLPYYYKTKISELNDDRPEIETVGYIARTCTQSYNLVPNFVSPMAEKGFPILLWWPKSVNECIFDVIWVAPDWGEGKIPKKYKDIWDAHIEGFNGVLDEDLQFGGWIQKAVDSYVFDGVPLSYQEARIYHWHQQVDKIIGLNKIPQELCVAPKINEDWMHPNDNVRRLQEHQNMTTAAE